MSEPETHSNELRLTRFNISSIRDEGETTNDYRNVIFIMFGIVMTQSFYLLSNLIFSEKGTFSISYFYYAQWVFVNILIIGSWLGYMTYTRNHHYMTSMRGSMAFCVDIIILLQYSFLLYFSVAMKFDKVFLDTIHFMFLLIFVTYLVWNILMIRHIVINEKIIKKDYSDIKITIGAIIAIGIQWIFHDLVLSSISISEPTINQITYTLFKYNLEPGLLEALVILTTIMLFYRYVFKQNEKRNYQIVKTDH